MTCAWILRLLSPASMFYSYSVVYSLSFSLMGISMGLDSEGEGLRQEGFPRTAAPDGLAVSRDGSAALLGLLTRKNGFALGSLSECEEGSPRNS